jgi:dCMP deaminase
MNWHSKFISLCDCVARWSKDPSTKVGAVIVDDRHRIVSVGYNGFPRGVNDSQERLLDRATKLQLTVHAEPNAILNSRGSVEGCSLYINSLPPCHECARLIINAGIRNVFYPSAPIPERWKESCSLAQDIFKEAGVECFPLINEDGEWEIW